jgi:hypothetical protein
MNTTRENLLECKLTGHSMIAEIRGRLLNIGKALGVGWSIKYYTAFVLHASVRCAGHHNQAVIGLPGRDL